MFDRVKAQWHQLEESRPGHRFRDRYQRHQRDRSGAKLFWRIARMTAATALLLVGIVFMVIPGPAILFFALAGALLATDSLAVAKLLDWVEVQSRRLGRFAKRHWDRMSAAGKVAISTLSVLISAGVMFLFLRLMMR